MRSINKRLEKILQRGSNGDVGEGNAFGDEVGAGREMGLEDTQCPIDLFTVVEVSLK